MQQKKVNVYRCNVYNWTFLFCVRYHKRQELNGQHVPLVQRQMLWAGNIYKYFGLRVVKARAILN